MPTSHYCFFCTSKHYLFLMNYHEISQDARTEVRTLRKYAASSAVLWVWVVEASLLTMARLVSARNSADIASFRRSLAAVLHSVKDWPIGGEYYCHMAGYCILIGQWSPGRRAALVWGPARGGRAARSDDCVWKYNCYQGNQNYLMVGNWYIYIVSKNILYTFNKEGCFLSAHF